MSDAENMQWIKRIWDHRRAAKENRRYAQTNLWDCIKATMALYFDLEATEDQYEEFPYGTEIDLAWNDIGTYHTDYGDGRAFEALGLIGFRYYIYEDGTL